MPPSHRTGARCGASIAASWVSIASSRRAGWQTVPIVVVGSDGKGNSFAWSCSPVAKSIASCGNPPSPPKAMTGSGCSAITLRSVLQMSSSRLGPSATITLAPLAFSNAAMWSGCSRSLIGQARPASWAPQSA